MAEIDYTPRFSDTLSANLHISELQGRLTAARGLNDRLHNQLDDMRLQADERSLEVEQLMEILNGCESCALVAKLVAGEAKL